MTFKVDMGTIWRVGLAFVLVSNAYYFRERCVQHGFRLLRSRFGAKRLLKDLEMHFLAPVSWGIVLVALYIAVVILQFNHISEVSMFFQYAMGVPIIVATIALRRVVAKASIRYFGWDEFSREDYSRVLMVTESIGFVTMVLILIECFYIYVPNSAMMQELVVVFFTLLEVLGILAFYTTVRNAMMGFFLIFAEPFSTGSVCSIGSATGVVEQMALNTTVLRAMSGALVHIPNSVLASDHQRNYSECTFRKIHVTIPLDPSTPVCVVTSLVDDLRDQLSTCIVSSDVFQQKEAQEVCRSDSVGARAFTVSELSHGSGTTAALDSMAGIGELGSKCHSFRVHDLRCLQVTLTGMHRVLVTALIEGNDLKTLAKAKSKVNLTIMTCLERHGVFLNSN
ncbi:small mechanosensitive channel family protein [Achlya hypogyna]|uniref:Small mechanosensitive channel family protein n=1 Tax=Achlya hypogyna TaxID=1202772 RepID=A0A1V9Z511_ACHHY|nr:small mechanosensitive channel family protein [Achlya hypogyna]